MDSISAVSDINFGKKKHNRVLIKNKVNFEIFN